MLSHAEIVVAAPDHDLADAVRPVRLGQRIAARLAGEIGPPAIPALVAPRCQPPGEPSLVVHGSPPPCPPSELGGDGFFADRLPTPFARLASPGRGRDTEPVAPPSSPS